VYFYLCLQNLSIHSERQVFRGSVSDWAEAMINSTSKQKFNLVLFTLRILIEPMKAVLNSSEALKPQILEKTSKILVLIEN
jgi:hypothetical protein